MKLEEIVSRWMRILSLVRLQSTGAPPELARRLGITVSTLRRDIRLINKLIDSNLLQDIDQPVVFDKARNTYLIRQGP